VTCNSGHADELEEQICHLLASRQGENGAAATRLFLAVLGVDVAAARNREVVRSGLDVFKTKVALIVRCVLVIAFSVGIIRKRYRSFFERLAGVEPEDGAGDGGEPAGGIASGRRVSGDLAERSEWGEKQQTEDKGQAHFEFNPRLPEAVIIQKV
jgi:hypothetical protein